MAERGIVKLRRFHGRGATGRARSRTLTVPAAIAREIPDGSTFRPELTDEGLLYRPVYVPPTAGGPRWLQGIDDVDTGFDPDAEYADEHGGYDNREGS